MDQSNPEQLIISINKDVPVETRFKFLLEHYYFHQLIGASKQTNHYLVEEIMNDTDKPIFYYLKQLKCSNKQDHHQSIDYYTKFLNYCGLQTAKKHIVKLIRMHEYEERDESYHELVLVFQFGESDRIDIDIMEPEQVLRFIKNVCVLLNDVSTHAHIHHCNLGLKNIVICNEEPSISGFKPIFMSGPIVSWKQKFIQKYGVPRLEMFCVGLLWLNFLNVDVTTTLSDNRSLEEMERDLVVQVSQLPSIRKIELLTKLIAPSQNPELLSNAVILEFDEYFILERISKRIESTSIKETEQHNSFDTKLDVQMEFNSKSLGFANSEASSHQNSQKSELNLFTKNLKELVDQESYSDLEKKSVDHSHHQAVSHDFKTNQEFTLNEGFSVIKKNGGNGGESRVSEAVQSNKGGESRNFLIGESGVTLKGRGSEQHFTSLKEIQRKQKDDPFKSSSASVAHEHAKQERVILEKHEDSALGGSLKGASHHKESLLVDQSVSLVEGDDVERVDLERLMTTESSRRPDKHSIADQLRISDKLGVVTSVSKALESGGQRKSTDQSNHSSTVSENNNKVRVRQSGTEERETNTNEGKKSSKHSLLEKIQNNPINRVSDPKSNPKTSTNGKTKTETNQTAKVAEDRVVSKVSDGKTIKKESIQKNQGKQKSSVGSSIKLESDKLFKKDAKKQTHLVSPVLMQEKRISDGHENSSKDEGFNTRNDFYVSNAEVNSVVNVTSEGTIKNPGDFLSAVNLEDSKHPREMNGKNSSAEKRSENRNDSNDKKEEIFGVPEPRSPLRTTPRESEERPLRKSSDTNRNNSTEKSTGKNKSSKSPEIARDSIGAKIGENRISLSPKGKESPNEKKQIVPLQRNPLKPLIGKHPITLHMDYRTPTNLFPEIVEKMLQKRKEQQLLKVKSEHLFKQMKEKEEIEKRLKQEHQDMIVQELVENNLRMKIKKEFEKTESQKRVMEIREIERLQKDTELFDKLKKIAEEKHKQKKKEQFEQFKDKKVFLSKTSKEHEAFDDFKKQKKHRPENEEMEKSQKSDKINNLDELKKQQKEIRKKQLEEKLRKERKIKRNVSENILNKKNNREFELTPIDEIDKKFVYNHHHQVFQIPFRKVVQNFADEEVKKSESVDKLSKAKQKSVLEKFEETLDRYKKTSAFLPKESLNNQNEELNQVLHMTNNRADFNSVDALNQFLEKGFLSKQMKSVVSENTQQFWSAGPRNFLNENEKDPLEFSHVRHIDVTNDALLNPVKEWKDSTIFRLDRIHQPNLSPDPHDLKGFAHFCQNNLSEERIDKIVERIQQKSNEVDHLGLIELNKIIASVFFCLDMPDKAKEELLNAVENVKELRDSETVEKCLGEIIFNLAFLEFTIGDIPDSIEMLKNPSVVKAFKPKLGNIIGNSLLALNKPKEARELFQSEAKRITLQEPTTEGVLGLYQYVCKILECFRREKNKIGPAEFFKDLENRLMKFSTLFKQMNKSGNSAVEGIELLILMKFLHFGQTNGNYGMMNYVLERSLKQAIIEPVENLTDSNKEQLARHLMTVCDYLKAKPNYGKFEANFAQYLDLADKLVQSSPLSIEPLKLHCSILFNKGIYQLQKSNKSAAREGFKRCFEVIHQLFQFEYRSAFVFVNKLAKAFKNKKDYENAMFFYEELAKFTQLDDDARDRLQLKMAKIHFLRENHAKAVGLLRVYLERMLLDPASPSSEKKLLKWICLFKISCLLSDDESFNKVKFGFEQQTIFSRNPISLQYCMLFKILENLVHNPASNDQNVKVLNYFRSIVTGKTTVSFEKGSELVDFVSVVYSKFSKDKVSVLHLLKDENASTPQNIYSACEFIENALVSLIFAFRTNDDFGMEERSELAKTIRSDEVRNEIKKTVLNEWEVTEPIESQFVSTRVNEMKERLTQQLFSVNKQHELQVLAQNRHELEVPNKSRDIMRRSHFNRTQCSCSVEEQQQFSPTKLIEQFLKQLKNMLFLDVTEDILSYYERFEAIIKEKGWNWNKFSYIPLLFNFFKKSKLSPRDFDQLGLLRIFDELFGALPLCIHDVKMIVLLLESFKTIQFLEVFVMYLHKMQSSLAGLVFNWMFLENFTSKFDQIVTDLYRKLYGFQFHFLENFSLMHLLSFESVLKIEKNLAFQIYQRHRFEVLADDKFHEVFLNYIDSKSLLTFKLRHETYASIVNLLKGDKDSQKEVLRRYQDKLFKISHLVSIDSENYRFLTYDFFLMANFIDFGKHPDCSVSIVQIMNFIKRKIPVSFSYHFAVVSSFVGNLFFKCKLYKETVDMKTLVLESLKNVENEPSEFPPYVSPVSLKQLLFGTLSFLYLSFTELKIDHQTETMFNKLMKYDYENKELNLEKDLVGVYQLYSTGELEKSMTNLITCRVDFENAHLKPRVMIVFEAALDRLDYLISEQMEEEKIVKGKKKKSDLSLAQLLKPL